MPSRIKIGDHVVVVAGKDKGKQGRVLKLDRAKDRVKVEGVNIITKHRRNNPQQPQNSGRVHTEGMIHMSNDMPSRLILPVVTADQIPPHPVFNDAEPEKYLSPPVAALAKRFALARRARK